VSRNKDSPQWEISSLQAAWLIAGAVSLTGHALAVSHFIRVGGRDSWLSGLIAFPAAAAAILAQISLSRRFPGKTIAQYLPLLLGPAGRVAALVYSLWYLTVVVFTMRMTTDWLVDALLRETPSWVMGALYLAAVVYAANGGLEVLARINQFVLPLLTALGLLVSFSTMTAKDYRLLLPMFEHGWAPVAMVSFLGIGYYGETSVLAMFTAHVKPGDRKRLTRSYLLALLFLVSTMTGPLAGSVATLGYRVAQNMPYPTFQHWLMVSFARFFERTDLLAVHQWLAGAYVRCALFLLMGVQAFRQATGAKTKLSYSLVGAAVAVGAAAELLWSTKPAFDEFVLNLYLPASAVLGIGLPILLWAVAAIRSLLRPKRGAAHGA
jgi:spore germination protein KB